MKTTDFIRLSIETSKAMTLGLVTEMQDAPLTQPTANGGNHPLWILGHLVYSESNIVNHIILGNENPLVEWKEMFGQGSQPVTDPDFYPPLDQLLEKFESVRAETLKVLDGLSCDDLDQPCKNVPPERDSFFGTVGRAFMVISLHPAMHFGQVADARRSLGREPAFA